VKPIYLIPAMQAGGDQPLKVRMPDNPLATMPLAGHQIIKNGPYYVYWLRRISDGSVIQVSRTEWQKRQPKKHNKKDYKNRG